MLGNNNLCWQNAFEKIILQCSKGSGSWKYNLYFPVDEVTRNMKDYIVNIVDELWKKRTESSCSTNVNVTHGHECTAHEVFI